MSKWKQMKRVKKHRAVGKRVKHNKKSVRERRRIRKEYYKDMARKVAYGTITDEKFIKELKKNSEYNKFYRQVLCGLNK